MKNTNEKMTETEERLKKLTKKELQAMFMSRLRVGSCDEMADKWSLISSLLEWEYGRKALVEFYRIK